MMMTTFDDSANGCPVGDDPIAQLLLSLMEAEQSRRERYIYMAGGYATGRIDAVDEPPEFGDEESADDDPRLHLADAFTTWLEAKCEAENAFLSISTAWKQFISEVQAASALTV